MSHPCPISFKLIPMIPRNKGNHLLLNQLSCILLIFGVTQVFTATLNLTMQQQNDLELDQRKVLFFCFGSRTDRFVSTSPVLWNLDLKWCDTLPQNLPQMSGEKNRSQIGPSSLLFHLGLSQQAVNFHWYAFFPSHVRVLEWPCRRRVMMIYGCCFPWHFPGEPCSWILLYLPVMFT